METSLLATKLFVPPSRPGLVPRPRLMERLQAAVTSRLTLVSAQAGYGKTTVLTQWISESRPPVGAAWVSLDEGDNDPVRFWAYFIAALRTLWPSIGEAAVALLHSPQPYPTKSVLTALINDLVTMPHDFAVVLDDYHLIRAEAIHTGIAFLLEHLPPKMHLVIASRIDPALPLAHFRGRSTMLEIDADDLRFTPEEASFLLKETLGAGLDVEDIRALTTRTEGWAVGLTMAALSMGKRKDVRGFIATFTGSQRYVMDYLIEEVLKQQPADIRDFLLKTSVLERLAGPLCDSITGGAGGQDTLVKLESSFGGFLVPLDASRQWYRYHHLLADLLRHQLERVSGAEEVKALHQRASQWYEHNLFPDDAIHHAVKARDWASAMRVLAGVADNLMRRGEMATVLNWLRPIPDEVLRSHFQVYRQYSRVLVQAGQFDAAEAALGFLEHAAPENANLQGEVAALKADLARRMGDDYRATELARKALLLLPEDRLVFRSSASHTLGLVHYEQGLFDEAASCFSDAHKMGLKAADHLGAAEALAYVAFVELHRGRLQASAELSRKSIELAEQLPAAELGRNTLGLVLYEQNELEEAARNQQLAMDSSELRGRPEHQVSFRVLLARTRIAQGDPSAILAAIADADQLLNNNAATRPGIRAFSTAFRALLALRQGDLVAALRWYDRLAEVGGEPPFNFRHIPARLLIARGDKTAAAEQLQALHDKAVQAGAIGLVVTIRVYQNLAAPAASEALVFLADALRLGEREGFIRTFVDEGRLVAPALRQALSAGITPEYTHKLLKIIEEEERRRKAANTEATSSVPATGLLSERELEILRLVAAGQSNREIAAKLIIALGTAKTHVHSIFQKLNAKDRLQAVTRARELKLV